MRFLRKSDRFSRHTPAITPLLLWIFTTSLLAAQIPATPRTGTHVSLCIPLRLKHNNQLPTLKPSDLTLRDAGRLIDSREMQIVPAAGDQNPLVTFIFDRLSPPAAGRATRNAQGILAEFAAHPMLLGVWSIDTQLRILQTHLDDKAATGKAFTLTSAPAGKSAALLQPVLDEASTAVLAETARLVINQRAPSPAFRTYATLLAAAYTQRSRPGRKAIILFTEQPKLDGNTSDTLRELPQALRNAGISLFVVDANALDEASSNQAMVAIAMGGQSANNYYTALANLHATAPLSQSQGMAPLQFQAMKDTIVNLEAGSPVDQDNLLAQAAESSGGAYIFAGASTRKFTRQVLTGLDDYVTVTYSVSADQQDGRFHSVAVHSMRPDITVAIQPGYFASRTGDPGSTTSAVTTSALIEADPGTLEKGAIAADLHLDLAALRFGHDPSGTQSVLALEISLPQLQRQEDEHTHLFSLHATAMLELRDRSGTPVARVQQEFRRRGALGSESTLATQAFSLQRQITLPPGDYTLNATLRDWNAETFTKASHPITVVAQPDIQISDLIVVRSVDPVAEDGGLSALQYGDRQVIPSLSGQLAADTAKASLYFQLYTAPSAAEASPRTLSLTLSKDGKHLATLPLQPDNNHLDGIATHLFTVSLNRGSGIYDIEVDLKQGDETVTRRASLLLPPSVSTAAHPEPGDPATDAFVASREISIEPSASSAAFPLLSTEQSTVLLAATRKNALTYTDQLPNFIGQETISRAIDHTGTGAWKPRDVIVESLHYQDKIEQRTILKVDGENSSISADHIEGARSNGEFGTLLRAIFEPSAQAQFTWIQSEERDGNLLHVFRFNVPLESSLYTVTDHTNSQLHAAFHGLVVIDAATHAVRRLFLQTDGLPPGFGVKSSWIAMNYDYVQINNHDYLLPSHGEIGLQQGKHDLLVNRIEFAQYRRFGARSHVLLPGDSDILP